MGYQETLAAFRRGDNAEAERLARIDLDEATASGITQDRVDALCMLGRTALRDGRFAELEDLAQAALGAAGEDPRLRRIPLHLGAVAARMTGRYDDARELYLESIALNDMLHELPMAAAEHRNLAYVELHAGHEPEARRLFAEARLRAREVDASALDPYLVLDEATVAVMRGEWAAARSRLAEAEAEFAERGVVPDPDDAWEMAQVRERLDGLTGDTSS